MVKGAVCVFLASFFIRKGSKKNQHPQGIRSKSGASSQLFSFISSTHYLPTSRMVAPIGRTAKTSVGGQRPPLAKASVPKHHNQGAAEISNQVTTRKKLPYCKPPPYNQKSKKTSKILVRVFAIFFAYIFLLFFPLRTHYAPTRRKEFHE